MLDICRNYANRWRYTYNPAKCSSMLMDMRQRQNTPLPVLRYRETLIQEHPTYTHLGIVQSSSGKYPCNIDDVRQGLRRTYFMLANSVPAAVGLSPWVMAKLYTTCVLPKALFACELWNAVSASAMAKLESTHHMCPSPDQIRHGDRAPRVHQYSGTHTHTETPVFTTAV